MAYDRALLEPAFRLRVPCLPASLLVLRGGAERSLAIVLEELDVVKLR